MHVHFLGQGPLFLIFFTLLIISYTIVIYSLVRDAAFGVLLATLFHVSINWTNLLFLDVIYETRFMVLNGTVWALLAAVLVWRMRGAFLTKRGA
jgi:hypothetical protein